MKFSLTPLLLIVLSSCALAGDYLPFHWTSYEQNGKVFSKSAILVPVQIEGSDEKLFAQLDTGADLTSFYGPALRRFHIPVDSVWSPHLKFRWYDFEGGFQTLGEYGYLRWDMGKQADPSSNDHGDRIVATIGMDQLQGKVLVIDFPEVQFAVVDDTTSLHRLISGSVQYLPAEFANFKFYIDLVLSSDTLKHVRFDSGSSVAGLILPLEFWQLATGHAVDDADITHDSLPSWGKYVHMVSAPGKGDLVLGSIHLPAPEVMYIDWPDSTLRDMSFLGNASFADSCLVVLDCINARFGIACGR